MSWGKAGVFTPLLLVPAPALAQSALVYHDHPICLACDAVAYAGLDADTFYSDGAAFSAAAAAMDYDLVVVESPSGLLPVDVLDVVVARAAARDPLILSYWFLDGDPGLAAVLGVSARSYDTPVSMVTAGGARVDFLVGLDGRLAGPTYDVGDNGDFLTLTGAGWLAVSEEAGRGDTIAVTNSESTIVNGWMPYDFQATDDDGDGWNDAVEVYLEELAFLSVPDPRLVVSGACPGVLTVQIDDVSPGESLAIVAGAPGGSTVPAGPCAGLPLELSGPRLVRRVSADGAGRVSLSPSIGPELCGTQVQVVSLHRCRTSAPATL